MVFSKKKAPVGSNLSEAEQNELFLGQHNAQQALDYFATMNRHGVDRELKKVLEVAKKVAEGKATMQDFRNVKRSTTFPRVAGASENFVLAIKRMLMKAN